VFIRGLWSLLREDWDKKGEACLYQANQSLTGIRDQIPGDPFLREQLLFDIARELSVEVANLLCKTLLRKDTVFQPIRLI
jgi:hypothetical protein